MTFVDRLPAVIVAHFRTIWVFLLLLLLGWGRAFTRDEPRASSSVSELLHALAGPIRFRKSDWLWLAAFLCFIAGYVFLILRAEDFADYDDSILTDYALIGRNYPVAIFPNIGRFFPLGHQEFNFLRLFTHSPVGYHAFGLIELFVLLCATFLILQNVQVWARFLILALIVVTPSFVVPTFGLIFPERNVLTLLALFVLLVASRAEFPSRAFIVLALVVVHFLLYFKEPIAVFLAAFAGVRLAIAFRQAHGSSQPWRKVWSSSPLELGIAVQVLVFAVLFVAVILPHPNLSYADTLRSPNRTNVVSVFLAYLRINGLLGVFIAVVGIRATLLLRRREAPDPVWDALAVGALSYAAVVLVLRMYESYFMAPVDLIAILYLVWLALRTPAPRGVVVAVAAMVALQNLAYSAFHVVERKNTILGKERLASFFQQYLRGSSGKQTRVYFPYASGYRLMELSAFLDYKGLPLAPNDSSALDARTGLVFEGPGRFPDDRCIGYRMNLCVHRDAPSPNDLVVLLPDDAVPAGVPNTLAKSERLLLFSAPVGAPRKLLPIFSALRAVSPMFVDQVLSDAWLDLYVFKV